MIGTNGERAGNSPIPLDIKHLEARRGFWAGPIVAIYYMYADRKFPITLEGAAAALRGKDVSPETQAAQTKTLDMSTLGPRESEHGGAWVRDQVMKVIKSTPDSRPIP